MGSDDSGRRLDRILRRVLKENSQGAVESALRKGLVRLNGKKAKGSDLTSEGDVLSAASFLVSPLEEKAFSLADCPYPIIFKNQSLLFIDKPSGVPTHGPGSVAEFFSAQKNSSLSFCPAPLHRLDKETSGLLALSQSLKGARWFSEKIKSHEIKKYYLGIVKGRLSRKELWEDFIEETRGPEKNSFATSRAVQEGGKAAKTIAEPLAHAAFNGQEISLVRFQIFTGRKRQIRAQGAARGLPILGDKKYRGLVPGLEEGKFFLRAVRMEFPQNDLGLPPFIDAGESQDFLAFFKDSR